MQFLFYYFVVFAVLGWILEMVFRSVKNRRMVNPGFLKGFYLPVYGFGALLILGGHIILANCIMLFRILFYFISLSVLELSTGMVMEDVFHVRLWDYTDERFNIRGHVCLRFAIYWTAIAVGLDFVLDFLIPWALQFHERWYPVVDFVLGSLFLMIFLDFIVSARRRMRRREGMNEKDVARQKFVTIVQPLLDHPSILILKDIKHHLGKSRLEHCLDVAWWSFLIARSLSLDDDATVRGALLHDLFYYDWLHEGPRLHGFRHPTIALKNARKITPLSKKEEDIIKKHMWPLTVIPPCYKESFVVSLVDKLCSVRDYMCLKKLKKCARRRAIHRAKVNGRARISKNG
ncbi:Metal dependent phosphohydrolase [Desulfosarcina cetonica]|uniref:putative ABC transporter permease n=1 Tax=Desulfosarcina cetonica TaxID=90730 RepID=UPI0006D04F57|nr:HD domain-containing protein [Desulfosarcina cetonica]VTR70373.1 Metal dependent phosphohydrolase [Desulfosarcina cetonica]